MAVKYFHDMLQGSVEWYKARLGLITASALNKILTPTLKTANNAETKMQIFNLAAERALGAVDENFVSYAMERGRLEEVEARKVYKKTYAEDTTECGIVINDDLGFPIGFSPDALVGEDGQIEVKSRMAKFQVQTVIQHMADPDPVTPIPLEFMLQVQGGLFVTKRKWCDFISYSNGVNMIVIRCFPDPIYQAAISLAVEKAEHQINDAFIKYNNALKRDGVRVVPVEWIDHNDEIRAS